MPLSPVKMGVMFAMVSRWLHSEGLQVALLVSHERECTCRFLLSSRCAPAFKQALIRRFLPRTSAFSQFTSTVLSRTHRYFLRHYVHSRAEFLQRYAGGSQRAGLSRYILLQYIVSRSTVTGTGCLVSKALPTVVPGHRMRFCTLS